MSNEEPGAVTRVLQAVQAGEEEAAAELLDMVYAELRRLAQRQMAGLAPGQTLQATALVHDAYLRLTGNSNPGWDGRRHFFGAAARAMRNILVDQARCKAARKRGGDLVRIELSAADTPDSRTRPPPEDLMALDEALEALEREDPRKAEHVQLRYFAGLSRQETATALGVTVRTIDREWRYIIAWLHKEILGSDNIADA